MAVWGKTTDLAEVSSRPCQPLRGLRVGTIAFEHLELSGSQRQVVYNASVDLVFGRRSSERSECLQGGPVQVGH
ncbi:MAG: hypothetical protein JF888_15655 [Candidatus Dormibacteraeota bacterium]|uniref:Uncharacterized protein n=1 Tax=Candidatus Dormiibacter inghamiae TaxID=3127013 RepID=A0A934KJ75_9BACT|nr:hypothetical protein [Candidatus Dormibacteraeota bacterium]